MSIARRKNDAVQAENDLTAVGISRRRLWQSATVMLGALTTASRAMSAPCAAADGSDSGLRKSLHYVESSPDPAQHCSGCSFFSDPQGDCGSCMIFNGPTNKNGHCDSWAARS
jgi:hypothetical protein